MGYEANNLRFREPTQKEIRIYDFYVKTGCIKPKDLEKLLGDIGIGVSAFSMGVFLDRYISN